MGSTNTSFCGWLMVISERETLTEVEGVSMEVNATPIEESLPPYFRLLPVRMMLLPALGYVRT